MNSNNRSQTYKVDDNLFCKVYGLRYIGSRKQYSSISTTHINVYSGKVKDVNLKIESISTIKAGLRIPGKYRIFKKKSRIWVEIKPIPDKEGLLLADVKNILKQIDSQTSFYFNLNYA